MVPSAAIAGDDSMPAAAVYVHMRRGVSIVFTRLLRTPRLQRPFIGHGEPCCKPPRAVPAHGSSREQQTVPHRVVLSGQTPPSSATKPGLPDDVLLAPLDPAEPASPPLGS